MDVDQIKLEIEELEKSPEYKKCQRALILFVIGIVSLSSGLIILIPYNWSIQNGSGIRELYICSLIFLIIGFVFLLASLIGILLVPAEFRKKIKELNKQVRLKKI